jgi:hypothetical protein
MSKDDDDEEEEEEYNPYVRKKNQAVIHVKKTFK